VSLVGRISLSLAALTAGTGVAAQTRSNERDTLQAAGPEYQASGLRQMFFGKEYRSLWTTPI
jgi:hypothetical protein